MKARPKQMIASSNDKTFKSKFGQRSVQKRMATHSDGLRAGGAEARLKRGSSDDVITASQP